VCVCVCARVCVCVCTRACVHAHVCVRVQDVYSTFSAILCETFVGIVHKHNNINNEAC